jgi:hypothetical protein
MMRAISVRALVMWMLVPAAIALVVTTMAERATAQSALVVQGPTHPLEGLKSQ